MTTTAGHMRLERARERITQFAREPGVMESPRKRHRPGGERGGSLLRHQHHLWSQESEVPTRKELVSAAVRRYL